MKRLFFIFLIVFPFLPGCNPGNNETTGILRIDTEQNAESIQESGILKEYDVVALETSEEALIGRTDKIIVTDSLIYIADYRQTKSVFIFDRQGNFQRKISRFGRGPGEYIQIGTIFVDKYDGTLNILNQYPARIFKFALDGSGNPQTIELENVTLNDIVPQKDFYVGYTTVSSKGFNNIIIFDREGRIMDRQVEFPKGWDSYGFGGVDVFSEYDDRLRFKPIYKNEVYALNGNLFGSELRIDFGTYNWPDDIHTSEDYDNSEEEFIRIDDYQETNGYWLFHFTFQGQTRIAAVNKKDNMSKIYSLDSNKAPYLMSFGQIVDITQEQIITVVPAEWVAGYFSDEELLTEYPDQLKLLRKKVGEITFTDNPVIVIYKI